MACGSPPGGNGRANCPYLHSGARVVQVFDQRSRGSVRSTSETSTPARVRSDHGSPPSRDSCRPHTTFTPLGTKYLSPLSPHSQKQVPRREPGTPGHRCWDEEGEKKTHPTRKGSQERQDNRASCLASFVTSVQDGGVFCSLVPKYRIQARSTQVVV